MSYIGRSFDVRQFKKNKKGDLWRKVSHESRMRICYVLLILNNTSLIGFLHSEQISWCKTPLVISVGAWQQGLNFVINPPIISFGIPPSANFENSLIKSSADIFSIPDSSIDISFDFFGASKRFRNSSVTSIVSRINSIISRPFFLRGSGVLSPKTWLLILFSSLG